MCNWTDRLLLYLNDELDVLTGGLCSVQPFIRYSSKNKKLYTDDRNYSRDVMKRIKSHHLVFPVHGT